MFSLKELNPEQRKAVQAIEGPVLILAGAGSGKTKTITYRVAHMVSDLGITPSKILAVSFTNKATKEMQERVKELIGSDLLKKMTLCTFHSLGVKILKKEIHHLGLQNNFNIYTQSDQISLVRQALKHYKAGKSFDQKRILSKISFLKNKGIGNKEFPNSIYMDYEDPYDLAAEFVYHFYQDKLLFYNSIDFDDILFLTVNLFEKYPAIAEKYSNFFSYVMVDEYQDTNPLQFKIIKALTSTHQNICVVGDDDQSIYGFRGAEISNILFFEKNFPNAMVVKLEENYRSSGPILKLANEVIKGNKKRNEKNLWTKKYSDLKPILWAMGDADHEAEIVAEDILKHKNEGGKFSDIAILFRGNNQSSVVEDVLRMNGIPYHYLGGQKFFEKKEVMDLLAYLKVILNPHDEVALRRILNVPNRGIGLTTLTKYLNYAQETKIPLFSALNQFPNQDLTREKNIKSFT
ncbi:MAG: ATP-dependent helicase, partial [Bacteriovoracales bacterium]